MGVPLCSMSTKCRYGYTDTYGKRAQLLCGRFAPGLVQFDRFELRLWFLLGELVTFCVHAVLRGRPTRHGRVVLKPFVRAES